MADLIPQSNPKLSVGKIIKVKETKEKYNYTNGNTEYMEYI